MDNAVEQRRDLAQWLDYQMRVHPASIELGLDRVKEVANRLALLPVPYKTITVAGTNGKGSCATLCAGLIGDHRRTGTYMSPHLWRYNERIAVDGVPVSDEDLVSAFESVEAARGDILLTYFEFGTLAALWLFARAEIDVAVLEVGLGGRLDAVNIVDADVALVTSIGLDHTQFLGDTREAIAIEKSGIMRAGRPAFCGERNPPATLVDQAARVGADLSLIGRDFDLVNQGDQWRGTGSLDWLSMVPWENVYPANLALAICAVVSFGHEVAPDDIRRACRCQDKLPGRREVVDGAVPVIYDVAHNEQAVALLVETLKMRPAAGRTHLVLGMLGDKPVEAVARRLAGIADAWYPCGLDMDTPRGLSAQDLAARIGHEGPSFSDPVAALSAARMAAADGDRIIVCGSFHTVALARSPDHE